MIVSNSSYNMCNSVVIKGLIVLYGVVSVHTKIYIFVCICTEDDF